MSMIIDRVEHHIHDSSATNPVEVERCGDGTSLSNNNRGSSQIPLAETGSLNTAAAKQDKQRANEPTCSLSEVERHFRTVSAIETPVCLTFVGNITNQLTSLFVHVSAREDLCAFDLLLGRQYRCFIFSSVCF